jgi:hypothetical protein
MPQPQISQEKLQRLQLAMRDARLAVARAQEEARDVRRALERGESLEPGVIHVELKQKEEGGRRVTALQFNGAPIEF